jgi:Ca2+-transporting ATPase
MEPREGDEMKVGPVPKSALLIDGAMLSRAVLMVATTVTVTLGWFAWRVGDGVSLALAQTEAFTMVVLCAWFNALNCRSSARSALAVSPTKNIWLVAGVLVGAAAQLLVVYCRPLGELFGTAPFTVRTGLAMVAVASGVLWTEELRKLLSRALSRLSRAPVD